MKKAILLAFLVIALLRLPSAKRDHSRRSVSQHYHPQAMVGKANGYFDKAMGSNSDRLEGFNAGPAAMRRFLLALLT
jgi:hypothetical protein